MLVLAISAHVEPPFVEVCHLTTLPVLPLNVIVPVFVELHNVPPEYDVVPPTAGKIMVIVLLAVAVQPFASVAVTLYVVVVVGLTVIAVVVALVLHE